MRAALRGLALLATLAPATLAAQAADSMLTSYDAGGVLVIHHRRPASSNVFSVQLYLLGGSRQVTAANAGIEPLYLRAAMYGTKRYPGDEARRALARTGSSISVTADRDATVISLDGLKQTFDSSWAVFADRVLQPTLDTGAVATVRGRMLSDVARRDASPEALAWYLADSLAYRDHAYRVDPNGNPASLAALTPDVLRAYAREHFVTSRMLVVVVGDIEPERVKAAVASTFGTLPRGSYAWTLPAPVALKAPEVLAVERPTRTNYVIGYMNGPSRGSQDFIAFQRGMSLFSGVLSDVVREQATLSYSAFVTVFEEGATGAAFYMSTTQPDSALLLVDRVATLLSTYDRDITIPRQVLRKAAEGYTTAYVFGTESAASHAEMLARAHMYQGDFRLAARQAEIASKITFADMRNAVRTYAKNIQYVYVGDLTRFSPDKLKKR